MGWLGRLLGRAACPDCEALRDECRVLAAENDRLRGDMRQLVTLFGRRANALRAEIDATRDTVLALPDAVAGAGEPDEWRAALDAEVVRLREHLHRIRGA